MEHFYVITKDNDVAKKYWDYKNSEAAVVKAFDEFAKEADIKAEKFHPSTSLLWILPSDEDIEKFKNEFTKGEDGKFKKTSATNKAWVKKCKDENIEFVQKPFIPFIFNFPGRSQWRLFDVGGEIYCTFDCQQNVEAPEGFVEMKGSEFYTIMESYHISL